MAGLGQWCRMRMDVVMVAARTDCTHHTILTIWHDLWTVSFIQWPSKKLLDAFRSYQRTTEEEEKLSRKLTDKNFTVINFIIADIFLLLFFDYTELMLLYLCLCQLSVLQKQAVPKVSFLPWCARYAWISRNRSIANVLHIFFISKCAFFRLLFVMLSHSVSSSGCLISVELSLSYQVYNVYIVIQVVTLLV